MNRLSSLFVLVPLLVLFSGRPSAEAQTGSSGKLYGIVIAVSKYDDESISSLSLVANDAKTLANTLHQRGGFEITPLYEGMGTVKSSQTAPTKANIMESCQRVLQAAEPGDTVFLYFSGHGNADPNDPNKSYLLPKDCRKDNFPDSYIETAWLRDQLARCQASVKFLVLDACHSGGEKASSSATLSSHELIGDDIEGVVTLASCTKNQYSYFWEEKEMSMFSYWLNEGLKGNADSNGDGTVTFNELDEFVNTNVSKTVLEIKGNKQTPVRIIRSDVSGVPVVIQPRPVSLDLLLNDVAEHIVAAMQLYNVKRTGVLEFSSTIGGRALDRAKYGTFAAYCAERLEERISNRLPRRVGEEEGFDIVNRETLEKTLKSKEIGVDDLFDPKVAATKIEIGGKPLPSFVVGTIENQRGSHVKFQCTLLNLDSMNKLHSSRGAAVLTESEWGMLGASAMIPEEKPAQTAVTTQVVNSNVEVTNPADFIPPSGPPRVGFQPAVTQDLRLTNTAMVDWLDASLSHSPHPLLCDDRRFDVVIEVKTDRIDQNGSPIFVPRQAVTKGNNVFVQLHRGEVYRIRLHNNWPTTVAARVLVDGLNTLPQKSGWVTKFSAIAPVEEEEMAPRVNLEHARYWLLRSGSVSFIPGFIERTGSGGAGREFRITDVPSSLAAQKEFTEQIGIITVALYSTKSTPRTRSAFQKQKDVGTEPGEEINMDLKVRTDLTINQPLAFVQVHYASQEAIDEMPGTIKNVQPPRKTP